MATGTVTPPPAYYETPAPHPSALSRRTALFSAQSHRRSVPSSAWSADQSANRDGQWASNSGKSAQNSGKSAPKSTKKWDPSKSKERSVVLYMLIVITVAIICAVIIATVFVIKVLEMDEKKSNSNKKDEDSAMLSTQAVLTTPMHHFTTHPVMTTEGVTTLAPVMSTLDDRVSTRMSTAAPTTTQPTTTQDETTMMTTDDFATEEAMTSQCRLTQAGAEYNGMVATADDGTACQRWDELVPHEHMFTDHRWFPDQTLQDAANYCRNPDGDKNGPWCYTTNEQQPWSYCHVPTCEEEEAAESLPGPADTPSDCEDIWEAGIRADGVYDVTPDTSQFPAYCDLSDERDDGTSEGGWTVILRRVDNTRFNRTGSEYVDGFGDLYGSHWLGLAKLEQLTRANVQLHVYMEDYHGDWAHAHYDQFSVVAEPYSVTINGYSGTAGDAIATCDLDCAPLFDHREPSDCYCSANPNGDYGERDMPSFYGEGAVWKTFSEYTLKTLVMKLKS